MQGRFDMEDLDDGGNPTFSVSELSEVVNGMFRRQFNDGIWVRGEIEGLQFARAGHVYFTLSERNTAGQGASLSVACFANTWNRLIRPALTKHRLRMENGLVVRLHGQLNVYAPSGKLSLVMDGLDARFTLGQLAADREQLIRRLLSEGLLDKNNQRVVPAMPLRVGVVTSVGSAAWHDFTHELESSGIGFHLQACDARVQGAGAAHRVAAAVATLADPVRRLDIIVVVRGGGSRTDLAAFDDEELARVIANCRVPVFTGVGHEIDRAIADEVAHSAFKTPTACAANLIERVRSKAAEVDAVYERIIRLGVERVDRSERDLRDRAQRAADRSRRSLLAADQRLLHRGQRVGGAARQAVALQTVEMRVVAERVAAVSRRHLLASEREVATQARQLARQLPRLAERAERDVTDRAGRIEALDPARAMARGWSITHRADGQLLRSSDQVAPGDTLITTLADGQVTSTVEKT